MRKRISLLQMAVFFFTAQVAWAGNIKTEKVTLVGNGIVEFIPVGYDVSRTPSLILSHEPEKKGEVPENWKLVPQFTMTDGKANASLDVPAGTSLYGGGEVTGPLLRNGQKIKMWNTDNGMYRVDGGSRLYQTHPWVLGVRPDGTAFGVLFDSFWKAELITNSDKIEFNTEGAPFRTYIIDRESPQAVLKGLAELTGTISMPPRWAIGYHQSRFSYVPEARVKEVANTFREKKIPCDVIWFDINYMDEFRVFTINNRDFPDPKRMNKYLHDNGFHSVYMIDPGVKVDDNYFVYKTGKEQNAFVCDIYRNEFHGKVWPGACAFPDFTRPETRTWWSGLYKDFMANGIDGIWNDMNEPSVFDGPGGTMPENNIHLGGGNLPIGSHLMYHNAYGRLMVEASYNGMMAANPGKRPFLLSRSNIIGGQRYAAMWTGDNEATYEQMKLSVPMSITLGLSGQPFNGPDIGGFAGNTTPDLWGNWLGFGAFFPFSRGHASCDTNNKEPWAFTKDIEKESRMALERRYRLLPYLYTAFHVAHKDGQPVMAPVFFADPKDESLRAEEQAFMLEKLYENVMNRYKYGGLDTPGLYLDETTLRICYSHRRLFAQLAKELVKQGDDIRARKVLEYAGQTIPAYNVPEVYESGSYDIATAYASIGETQKATDLLNHLIAESENYIDWAFSLGDNRIGMVQQDCLYRFWQWNQCNELLKSMDKKRYEQSNQQFEKKYMRFTQLMNYHN